MLKRPVMDRGAFNGESIRSDLARLEWGDLELLEV